MVWRISPRDPSKHGDCRDVARALQVAGVELGICAGGRGQGSRRLTCTWAEQSMRLGVEIKGREKERARMVEMLENLAEDLIHL